MICFPDDEVWMLVMCLNHTTLVSRKGVNEDLSSKISIKPVIGTEYLQAQYGRQIFGSDLTLQPSKQQRSTLHSASTGYLKRLHRTECILDVEGTGHMLQK